MIGRPEIERLLWFNSVFYMLVVERCLDDEVRDELGGTASLYVKALVTYKAVELCGSLSVAHACHDVVVQ